MKRQFTQHTRAYHTHIHTRNTSETLIPIYRPPDTLAHTSKALRRSSIAAAATNQSMMGVVTDCFPTYPHAQVCFPRCVSNYWGGNSSTSSNKKEKHKSTHTTPTFPVMQLSLAMMLCSCFSEPKSLGKEPAWSS